MPRPVTLPNGEVIENVPDDVSDEQVRQVMIDRGEFSQEDFADQEVKQESAFSLMGQASQTQAEAAQALPGPGTAIARGLVEIPKGVTQAFIGAAEDLGLTDPGSWHDFTQHLYEERDKAYQSALKYAPNMTREEFDDIMGYSQLAAGVVGGGVSAGAYGSIGKQILADTVLGSLFDASDVEGLNDPAQSFWGDISVGAVSSAGMQAVAQAPSIVMNRVKGFLKNQYFNSEQSLQQSEVLERYMKAVPGNENFRFSPGQASGNPYVISVEQKANVEAQLRRANEEVTAIENLFNSAIDKTNSLVSTAPFRIQERGVALVRQAEERFREKARDVWDNQVVQAISDAGNRQLGVATNLERAVGELFAPGGGSNITLSAAERRKLKGTDLTKSPAYATYQKIRAANKNGPVRGGLPGITGKDLNEVLMQINRFERGLPSDFDIPGQQFDEITRQRIGGQMRGAIEADIDDWYSRRGGGRSVISDPHIERIMAGRAAYRTVKERERKFLESSIYNVFQTNEPSEVVRRISSLNERDQRFIRMTLQREAPEMLADLQAVQLKQVLDSAIDTSNAAQFKDIDLSKIVRAFKPSRARGADPKLVLPHNQLLSKKQQELVINGLTAIKRIMNRTIRNPADIARAQRAEPGAHEYTMNIVSRDPTFATRLLTRAIEPGVAEKILLSPEGVKALDVMSKARWGSEAMANAMAYFIMMFPEGPSGRVESPEEE